MKKLIPLLFETESGKVKILWCNALTTRPYDSRWWGKNEVEGKDKVINSFDVDLCEREEIFDSMEKAHDAIAAHYFAEISVLK